MKTAVHARLKGSRSFGSRSFWLCLLLATGLCACSSEQKPAPAQQPAPSQRTPIGQLPPIDTDGLLAHTKVLSSDEYEGRAPGSKGEELSVAYISDQFKKAGLEPGNTDGTYVQKVPLVGITPDPAPLILQKGGQKLTLKWKDDVVA